MQSRMGISNGLDCISDVGDMLRDVADVDLVPVARLKGASIKSVLEVTAVEIFVELATVEIFVEITTVERVIVSARI